MKRIFDGKIYKKEVFVRGRDEENLYEAIWKAGEGLYIKLKMILLLK